MNRNLVKGKIFFAIIVCITFVVSVVAFIAITVAGYIPMERLARTLPLAIIIGASMITGAILLFDEDRINNNKDFKNK